MAEGKQRSLLWDIFKGFGIIFIVFGHTGKVGGAIVYLFHLALFFFVTGYFFNEEKYGDRPFVYLGHRIAGAWPKYVFYCTFFALTHNYAVIHGLMTEGSVIYGTSEFIQSVMGSMVFERPELYSGPMWFVPLWLLGAGLFAGVVHVSGGLAEYLVKLRIKTSFRRIDKKVMGTVEDGPSASSDGKDKNPGPELTQKRKRRVSSYEVLKQAVVVILTAACIVVGQFAVDNGINILYHMELAFVIEPFFALGYFMRKYLPDIQEKLPVPLMIVLSAVIFYIFTRFIEAGIWFDLASQLIFGMWFYVGGILGIVFTIFISKLLEKIRIPDEAMKKIPIIKNAANPIAGLVALAGRYSFDIMALHIFVFKMLDMVLRKVYYHDPGMSLSQYPSPLSMEWWILYLVVAVMVPLLAGVISDKVKSAVKAGLRH
ncbi:acyltransferase family protein [Oribacterium sp. P6A1]|uniref:acyltransferase family protein n=1 Tax=Oribacterium sp. P6A1 TaxID=1410612 RepID=UPI000569099D|nr:acyltransferase family protein [Oribacterium sp. P6A1]